MGDITRNLDDARDVDAFVVTPSHPAELINLIEPEKISITIVKVLFD